LIQSLIETVHECQAEIWKVDFLVNIADELTPNSDSLICSLPEWSACARESCTSVRLWNHHNLLYCPSCGMRQAARPTQRQMSASFVCFLARPLLYRARYPDGLLPECAELI
jgi:hypothetical protein